MVVTDSAKSAATLIALSADEILLGRWGELGPLDPQLRDPSGGSRSISPLETMQGLDFLRQHYLETLDIIMPLLLSRSDMDLPHVLEYAPRFLSPIATPLYGLVDYRELGDAVRRLSIGEAYATEVMKRWSPLGDNDNTVRKVVNELVWKYPYHGYIIDVEEANKIGLDNVNILPANLELISNAALDSMRYGTVTSQSESSLPHKGGSNECEPSGYGEQ